MTTEDKTPLTERKVVRRGILAALAGLGAAAAVKLTGADKAEAASANVVTENAAQVTASEIRISATSAFNNSLLTLVNGGSLPGLKGAVTGVTTGSGAHGVFGINHTSGGFGVRGSSDAGSGVLGQTTTGFGVRGTANTAGGIGIQAESTAVGALSFRGVHSANGTGVKGVSNTGGVLTSDGDGSGVGVHGKSGSGPGVKGTSDSAPGVRGESSNGVGVLGISDNQPGLDGVSNNSLGIRGTSTNFVGILGLSTNGHGLYGSTTGANAFGIVAENTGTGPGLLVTGNAQIFGALQVFGVKNAVIKMADGSNAAVYCQESPEPYFEDFGRAQLVGGVANVPLEREFATLVAGADYMVFLTPEGFTGGLYVSRRGPSSFEVREANGHSSVSFTYRIVTKRKDVEGKRFARVNTDAARRVSGDRARLGLANGAPFPPPQNYVPPANVPVDPSLPVIPPAGTAIPAPGLTVRQP